MFYFNLKDIYVNIWGAQTVLTAMEILTFIGSQNVGDEAFYSDILQTMKQRP